MASSNSVLDLLARLDRLEHRCKRQARIIVIICACAMMTMCVAAVPMFGRPEVVKAKAFLLINEQGKTIARFAPMINNGSPAIHFFDSDDRKPPHLTIGLQDRSAGLFLWDSRQQSRMTVGEQHDPHFGPEAGLFVFDDGKIEMKMSAFRGRNPSVQIYDQKHIPRFRAGMDLGNSVVLKLGGTDANDRILLEVDKFNKQHMRLFDESGRELGAK